MVSVMITRYAVTGPPAWPNADIQPGQMPVYRHHDNPVRSYRTTGTAKCRYPAWPNAGLPA
jgi:hypothetical protein